MDVWLIYQCAECKHTLNLAIYKRQKVSSIPKEQYQCICISCPFCITMHVLLHYFILFAIATLCKTKRCSHKSSFSSHYI
ncbi:MAG: DUF1062 domain-containing protein [Lachnospiraceae bacterium]|nr:DUF1062 domain-containing protein [Lachnospiraceae bacterium]